MVTTPRTKALRRTSRVTSSRAMAVPRHHMASMNAVDNAKAAMARRSPLKTLPRGNQPAPMLMPARIRTDAALKIRPTMPRRFRENCMVCTYHDRMNDQTMARAMIGRGIAASGSWSTFAINRQTR